MRYLIVLLTFLLTSCEQSKETVEETSSEVLDGVSISVPVIINSHCSTNATEGETYSCDFKVYDQDSTVHRWDMHSLNTCKWADIDESTGKLSGTVDISENCNLGVKVYDENDHRSYVVFTIKVKNAVNDKPVLTGPCGSSAVEDATYNCTLYTYDEDKADYLTLSYSMAPTNTCSWASVTPDNDDPTIAVVSGTPTVGTTNCTLAIRVYDSKAYSDALTTTVTVAEAVNDKPIQSASCGTSVNEDSAYVCNFTASDEENDTLTYALDASNTCTWASFPVNTTASVSGTPTAGGTCVLAFYASDGTDTSDVYSTTITVNDTTNDIPVITQACSTAINESVNYSCTFTATDEEGATLTYALDASTTCDWLSFSSSQTPTIKGLPTLGGENCVLAFTASDGVNTTAVETVNITVTEAYNDLPIVVITCPSSVDENDTFQCTFGSWDEEGDTLTFSLAANNTCSWASLASASDPTISAVVTEGGSCLLAVQANDGTDDGPIRSFTVTVNDTFNDVPVITESCATSLNEYDSYSCAFSATDEEGATLSYYLDATNTCTWAKISNPKSPLITGSPTAGINCNLVFYATDGEGNSALETIALTITDTIDDAPTVTKTGLQCPTNSFPEGGSYLCYLKIEDEEGAALTTMEDITTDPDCSFLSFTTETISGVEYGKFTGTPPDGNTTCNFSLQVSDGGQLSNIYSISLYVIEAQNDPPTIASACSTTATVGERYECSFTGSDPDTGDTVSFEFASANTCTSFLIPNSSIGKVVGYPASASPCTLALAVKDKSGTLVDDSSTYTITVTNSEELGFSQISAGKNFNCGITSEGVGYCWGSNEYGQLGDGTAVDNSDPQIVDMSAFASDNKFASISAGTSHACATTGSGKIYCWGRNLYSQLGDGGTTDSTTPVLVDTSSLTTEKANFYKVSAGENFTCGLNGYGEVYCWGQNNFGKIGIGDDLSSSITVPSLIEDSETGTQYYTDISLGDNFACALTVRGQAVCWGDNSYKQMGGTIPSSYSTLPIDFNPIAEDRLISISAGATHACGVSSDDGSIICWGSNSSGECGLGAKSSSELPDYADRSAIYTSGYGMFVAVSAGENITCAVDSAGYSYCWGKGTSGTIGDSNNKDRLTPTFINTSLSFNLDTHRTKQIAVGRDHVCNISWAGDSYCWGKNTYGQLGSTEYNQINYPYPVTMNDVGEATTLKFETLSEGASNFHVCGLTSNGKMYCWGDNTTGQLGDGNSGTTENAPVAVSWEFSTELGTKRYKDILTGPNHTCAAASDGELLCWGTLEDGEFGNSNETGSYITSETNAYYLGESNVQKVTGGYYFTIAHNGYGLGFASGDNLYAQLGLDNTTDREYFTTITNTFYDNIFMNFFKDIDAGNYHSCGILPTGQVFCWGYNYYGQGGVGNATTPLISKYPSTSTAHSYRTKQVSAGGYSTCILTGDGDVFCFGRNNYGQLGDGTNTDNSSVVQVDTSGFTAGDSQAFVQISVGLYHACGVTSDAKAYCWGYNNFGALGDGTNTDSNIPVEVDMSAFPADSKLKEIRSYAYSTCAISTNGNAYCWGHGTYGTLGNSASTNQNTPQAVTNTIP